MNDEHGTAERFTVHRSSFIVHRYFKYCSIELMNVFTSIGLEMYPSQPASRKRSLSPRIACAVSARIGMREVRSFDFMRRTTLSPSIPGRWMSMRIRSKDARSSSLLVMASASSPLVAFTMSYPPSSSRYSTSCMFMSLSSTTRIFRTLLRRLRTEEGRIEINISGLLDAVDRCPRDVLPPFRFELRPRFLERRSLARADFENVNSVRRLQRAADLSRLHREDEIRNVGRERLASDCADVAALPRGRNIIRDRLRDELEVLARADLGLDLPRLLHRVIE